VRHAAIAIANPVMGDMVRMTNHHWEFSIEALRRECGFDTFVVVNDFEALAMALPWLADADKVQVGGGAAVAGAPIGLLGAGTGLGVSGLIPAPDGKSWTALRSEGGHVTFSPANETEVAILQYAWREFEHVSAERLLSGAGVELIYRALADQRGAAEPPWMRRKSRAAPWPANARCAKRSWKPSAACWARWPATWPSRSARRAGCTSAAASCRAWASASGARASAAASSRRAASPPTWRRSRPM
jgi:glucokinase